MEPKSLTPDVTCEILPRRNASSDDLRTLGKALAAWSEEELQADGLLRSIDNIALLEMMGGG